MRLGVHVLVLLGGVAASAGAADIRVTTPAELRAAIAAVQPGDVVVLAPGTYDVVGIVRCDRPGMAGAPITVRAVGSLPPASAWQVVISPLVTDAGTVLDGFFHAYVARASDPCTGAEAD